MMELVVMFGALSPGEGLGFEAPFECDRSERVFRLFFWWKQMEFRFFLCYETQRKRCEHDYIIISLECFGNDAGIRILVPFQI